MKRPLQPRLFAFALLAGTALLFTACASATSGQLVAQSPPNPVPAGTMDPSDYVYVLLPGSKVPVLMLKSQAVTNYPGVSQSDISYLSPVAFHDLINRLSVGMPR
jgi:hypothetical protein